MSRLTLLALCLLAVCFVGCTSETPEGIDAEVPEAASGDKKTTTNAEGYQVLLATTKGDIMLQVHPEWSPKGAERFKELVELGFYDNCAFFRVIDGFMAQVGINGDPALHAKWRDNNIMDDPVIESNKRGYVSFAKTGAPNSRSTQFFINFGDNSNLDGMGFSPFAQVISGMDVVDSLYKGYGEGAPRGAGPDQQRVVGEGNPFLKKEFPMLDYIVKATIVGDKSAKTDAKSETAEPAAKDDKKPAEPAAEKSEEAAAKPEKAAATKE
ncbi:peptidylprolyl isomerase [uncultured Gimesia sp.]|uniref:peptidylprolyl isomerase n=1 Tax=uncultured Gimesia sp. TaxID=1678688 RepID=UPI0030DBE4AD|tara:strand:- start:9580 stop:10383 length:804 start_codon:yes stop_codon:yes gene_type:complete